jgi:mRNA interferase YafQ
VAKARPKAKGPTPRPPLTPVTTTRFERDVNRARRQGKDMARLWAVIDDLCHRRPLAARLKDHPLSGEWKGWRDCHVEPDWVLIYRKTEGDLILGRIGSHSDLFG